MVGCVLSQLKPSERYILRCGKGLGSAKNVAHRGLYPGADPEGGAGGARPPVFSFFWLYPVADPEGGAGAHAHPFLRQIILKIP